jgi:hypothetical protein
MTMDEFKVTAADELSRVEGAGDKARLVLDPEMLVQWDRLNPTEQYFKLLDASLRLARPEIHTTVGEPVPAYTASALATRISRLR